MIAKRGLGGDFPPLSAAAISMLTAMLALWAVTIVRDQAGQTLRAVRVDRRSALLIGAATFIGPLVGFWLSLVALQAVRAGIAATLMCMNPIFSLPVVRVVFGERITPRALVGTLVAMTGVILIVLL